MGKAAYPEPGPETHPLQRRETLVLETLLSALDARESAKAVQSPMLKYLSELLVQRARDELAEVREARDQNAAQR